MITRTLEFGGTCTVSFQVLISQGCSGIGTPVVRSALSSTWNITRCTCIGCIEVLGFSNCQISVSPRIGISVMSSQCSPITLPAESSDFTNHSLPAQASSTRSSRKRRVPAAADSGIGVTGRKVAGSTVVSPASLVTTNFMMLGRTGDEPSSLRRMISVPGAKAAKSITTSKRSAGAMLIILSGIGPSINPPSVPIRLNGITWAGALWFSSRRSYTRACEPLSMRNRYLPCFTFKNGHTLPLASAVSPRNWFCRAGG